MQWEYLAIKANWGKSRKVRVAGEEVEIYDARTSVFNELGSQGWELVTQDGTAHYFVFKRPKP